MEDDLFADAARQLLQGECTPARVRAIEAGGSPRALWQSLEQAGFADALAPEHAGGAGLALAQLFDVWSQAGAHALPVPLGETMLARALLAGAGGGASTRRHRVGARPAPAGWQPALRTRAPGSGGGQRAGAACAGLEPAARGAGAVRAGGLLPGREPALERRSGPRSTCSRYRPAGWAGPAHAAGQPGGGAAGGRAHGGVPAHAAVCE